MQSNKRRAWIYTAIIALLLVAGLLLGLPDYVAGQHKQQLVSEFNAYVDRHNKRVQELKGISLKLEPTQEERQRVSDLDQQSIDDIDTTKQKLPQLAELGFLGWTDGYKNAKDLRKEFGAILDESRQLFVEAKQYSDYSVKDAELVAKLADNDFSTPELLREAAEVETELAELSRTAELSETDRKVADEFAAVSDRYAELYQQYADALEQGNEAALTELDEKLADADAAYNEVLAKDNEALQEYTSKFDTNTDKLNSFGQQLVK